MEQGKVDGEAPLFILESKGELEAKLVDHPELLHAFDLRS